MSNQCVPLEEMRGVEDLTFDFDLASSVVTHAQDSIQALEGQQVSRASVVDHALEDFRGWFSEVFADNAKQAVADREQLVGRL
ncbi:MAG TPA: hypothetical protein VK054_10535, partial [Beutenbergiaceae bacterium]|nr:hypothetical protein [Beutenbergiaceae bacterium]